MRFSTRAIWRCFPVANNTFDVDSVLSQHDSSVGRGSFRESGCDRGCQSAIADRHRPLRRSTSGAGLSARSSTDPRPWVPQQQWPIEPLSAIYVRSYSLRCNGFKCLQQRARAGDGQYYAPCFHNPLVTTTQGAIGF